MKIIILGANGQLGMSLKKIFQKTSYKFYFFNKSELNINDHITLNKKFISIKPDVIINCCAYTAVDKAEKNFEEANNVNNISVGVLSQKCLDNDCFLIHISTDYVFDGISKKPFTEKDITCPINYYGKSKLSGELALLRNMPSNAIVIRTSWMYSEFENNFLNTMLNLGKVKNELKVVNDEIGSPTYALDLAQAIVKIIESRMTDELFKESQIYHFAGLGQCSWFEFANEIFKKTNINCRVLPIKSDDYVTIAKRPKYSVLDTTKISKDYDVNPKSWTESLYICINEINKTHV